MTDTKDERIQQPEADNAALFNALDGMINAFIRERPLGEAIDCNIYPEYIEALMAITYHNPGQALLERHAAEKAELQNEIEMLKNPIYQGALESVIIGDFCREKDAQLKELQEQVDLLVEATKETVGSVFSGVSINTEDAKKLLKLLSSLPASAKARAERVARMEKAVEAAKAYITSLGLGYGETMNYPEEDRLEDLERAVEALGEVG